MKIVSKPATDTSLINRIPAANADRLSTAAEMQVAAVQTGGWDAYEVWNRFIREARERRRSDQR